MALTALPEGQLRQQLAAAPAQPAAPLAIDALPAHTLGQRPDVFSAEREVAAASADVGNARAQRYPRLTLSGSIGVGNFRGAGGSTTADTWSIGPLALSLPLFDGGRRRANVDAAAARYDEAVLKYRGSVRQAVREVEEALVNLDSSEQRGGHAETALAGYRSAFVATEERFKNGIGVDIYALMHEGKLPPITEATSLGDVINGTREGRKDDDERICFITGGLPVWDVGWGYEIYSKAKEMGLGVELRLWDSPALG